MYPYLFPRVSQEKKMSSDLRQRKKTNEPPQITGNNNLKTGGKSRTLTLFIVGFIFSFLLFGLYYLGEGDKLPSKKSQTQTKTRTKIFTSNELKRYDGTDPSKPLYLAIIGEVYDVTKGEKHYGKDQAYSGFAGKDGSRAFATGYTINIRITLRWI